MKYIFVFEDGIVKCSKNEPTKTDLSEADNGLINIIRVGDLKMYAYGDWHDMETANINGGSYHS